MKIERNINCAIISLTFDYPDSFPTTVELSFIVVSMTCGARKAFTATDGERLLVEMRAGMLYSRGNHRPWLH